MGYMTVLGFGLWVKKSFFINGIFPKTYNLKPTTYNAINQVFKFLKIGICPY